jgi:hypothetical protein
MRILWNQGIGDFSKIPGKINLTRIELKLKGTPIWACEITGSRV